MHSVFVGTCRSLMISAVVLLSGSTATAQIDRVYTGADRPVSGKITAATRDGIVISVNGTDQKIPVHEISHVMYQGDPSGLTKGRDFAVDGQYTQALSELKTVDPAKLTRDPMRVDLAFYAILCNGKVAVSGNGNAGSSAGAALKFVQQNSNSIHFFPTTELLGDLALTLGEYDGAIKYYGYLDRSLSPVLKIKSAYLVGKAKLAKGDYEGAIGGFDKVANMKADSVELARMVTLAKAGRAVALANTGKGAEGIKLCQTLIDDLSPTDTDLAAEIYNAHGACLEATKDDEGAIFAYLHTHLMFSGNPQAHAAALKRLVPLWTKVGKADRASAARNELRTRYPGLSS